MGEAIESAVEESAVNIEESDKLQLSPAYQLVLNCIWLNLRVTEFFIMVFKNCANMIIL
jgi:hypothetical protein